MAAWDRLDALLLAGGALWGSIALHGALVVAAVGIDHPLEERIEIELRPPSAAAPPTSEPTPSAEPSGTAPAVVDSSPSTGDASANQRARLDPPAERLPWRQRLLRDEALFETRNDEDAQRLAMLQPQGGGGQAAEGVYRCGAHDRGEKLNRTVRRDLSRLAPVLPGAVLSDAYLAKIGQIGWARDGGRLVFDLALPEELLPIALEQPDVLVVVGRTDTRCFIQISVGARLFPLALKGLPVRVVDEAGGVEHAVVDVVLEVDASVRVVRTAEGALGFTHARLRDGDKLARQMEQHQGIFLTLKALGGG